ncbi:hypothetical protein P171DRAFT_481436 [Karstenula rhodostoma CBS 690.94]|uniref:Uncharacterized protein n=1 Tax=Karstenula rhodostoma CBS 690.94 TaxID=1392251 RepID=A0A9P4PQM7_9PLEO|nr:hypothetical protein P171DRAFT_481436 [Karstenula rhodostoma CBS 690.94]
MLKAEEMRGGGLAHGSDWIYEFSNEFQDAGSDSGADGDAGGTFMCALCVLRKHDPCINDETCSNDLRSLLIDMNCSTMADAEEALAEEMARASRRRSDVAKPWDWLGDFVNENPDAYVEEPVEWEEMVGGRGNPLARVRTLLREEARRNEEEARTMNFERAWLHGE